VGKTGAPPIGEAILVVEDNSANQKLIDKILTGAGYITMIVSNGQEALDAVADGSYDLILMDMHMPVMDGYEATGRLKGDEKYRHIPIVALTAQAMKGDEERVYEVGCDGYLSKPVKKLDLLKEIQRHLGGRSEEIEAPELEDDERDEIYKEFYATLPGEYEKIADAVDREDYDQLFLVGHDLKGAAGAFGLNTISMLGRQIEKAAKDRRIEKIKFAMQMLKEEIELLHDNDD
jgi:CheY-like chemotaxis protein